MFFSWFRSHIIQELRGMHIMFPSTLLSSQSQVFYSRFEG